MRERKTVNLFDVRLKEKLQLIRHLHRAGSNTVKSKLFKSISVLPGEP